MAEEVPPIAGAGSHGIDHDHPRANRSAQDRDLQPAIVLEPQVLPQPDDRGAADDRTPTADTGTASQLGLGLDRPVST